MHSITFMLKRAHWRNIDFAKKLVKKVHGMTPARFELLVRQAKLGERGS
jgi:hypothetical protein